MGYSDYTLKKQKYFKKTLSSSAIYNIYLRTLDASPLFAQYTWLQLSSFDLTELGMGLLYSILPVDTKPYSVDFTYVAPTTGDTLQGVWAKFEAVDFSKLYTWMTDFRTYVVENFKEEFQPELLVGVVPKACYGITRYARGVYDPIVAREFLRATFWKLRLIRTPDVSWQKMMDNITEYINMVGVTDEHIFNRLMMICSAQTYSFTLGLSILGRSRLTETVEGWGVVPIKTAKGNIYDLYFTTLDQLQMGLILDATPLGYGLLLPEQTIYKLPEGKRNPTVINVMVKKIRGIINRTTLFTWAATNYNKPEEMIDYHKSQRTNQYDLLMTQRSIIEGLVRQYIPSDERNPLKVRQYQNAVLQYISWKTKRHAFGFEAWTAMSEDDFKGWWKGYWKGQGLKEGTLELIWQGMIVWLKGIRQQKTEVGQKIQQVRKRLALLT